MQILGIINPFDDVLGLEQITTLSIQAPLFFWKSSIVDREDICINILLLSVTSCMLDCHAQRLVLHMCAGVKLKAWMCCIHLYLL